MQILISVFYQGNANNIKWIALFNNSTEEYHYLLHRHRNKLRIKMSRINGERDRDCKGAVGEVEEDFPF